MPKILTLEKIATELCQALPRDVTIFEKNGLCQKQADTCKYCKHVSDTDYFCYKKTYTPTANFNSA